MAKSRKPQPALELTDEKAQSTGPIECLGRTFENDEARRSFFAQALREKLKDPAFRQQDGFPQGTDEDILRMSDPPFYTACPNPFLDDFVRCHGRPYDPSEPYQREPFAVDTSVGTTDALYKAHGYHTKVPHLAIVPSILHYTKPGDIVLDGFAGSGMTGVAAQWCGVAPAEYRQELEAEWKGAGRLKPEWGARRAILNDLGPAATFIASGYNLPFDVKSFVREAERILNDFENELGWMYRTTHKDGRVGRINFTVWSEVFTCPECAGQIVFVDVALNRQTKKTRDHFKCPACDISLTKDQLERLHESRVDSATRQPSKRIVLRPVLLNYDVDGSTYEKVPDAGDHALLDKIDRLPWPLEVPTAAFDFDEMWEAPRLRSRGITHIHHLFLSRPAQALAALWRCYQQISDPSVRARVGFVLEQAIWGMSLLARYAPTHYSQVNRYLVGTYYVGSQIVDVSVDYILRGKLSRLCALFAKYSGRPDQVIVTTGTASAIHVPSNSVDYVFTDPPFGDNYPYAELNLLVESWHGVTTESSTEAIVDRSKQNRSAQKDVFRYQGLMSACMREYHRVLKPNRWLTVVFSNSKSSVWRALQEAIGSAGFVVADVRTLDKQQRTLKQVSGNAPKQDLVISAYKPSEALAQRFALGESTENGAWAFVAEHLRNVPVFVTEADRGEMIAERDPQMLQDRMIAFHVQRGLAVPISGSEFEAGLRGRFVERDGMFFLSHQVGEYDRRRASVTELKQLELFVTDESSAIRWARQQLHAKPRRLQDLTPEFTKQLQAWDRHEVTLELRDLLEQNFVHYDGDGPVPPQIHQYLSTNFKDLRKLPKTDPALVRKATGCWYVPDSAKAVDLEKLRHAALLREFQAYVENPQKRLKVFRTEAVRAGFKDAYDRRDYDLVVRVAAKLPESVLQEDEQLLMYYDVASTRLGR
jgi:hypothetical protein